ncbi:MAG: gliding motility-associated C-terminal domain-containing protein [Bacteroidetes bacterium]|nr:gliding motility-associated C-terminal domain-containing protein [Bacteroidota bacterium]
MRILLIYICLFSMTLPVYCQSSSDCGVKASFTPGMDSVSSTPFIILFTNTSTNASSVKWFVNGFQISTDQTLNYGFNYAGSYEIKLVAENGACTDTAISYILQAGTQPTDRDNIKTYYGLPAIEDYSTCLSAGTNGGYLLGGYSYYKKGPYSTFAGGLLIKTAESGCIEWSKLIEVKLGESKVLATAPLMDGGFVVSAYQDYAPFVMRLDAAGNMAWARAYSFDKKPFQPQIITQASDGGFIMAGIYWSESMLIVRTDANGNVLWNRAYKKYSNNLTGYTPISIIQKSDDVYFSGEVVQAQNENTDVKLYVHGFLIKLNDANGETRWSKEYTMNGNYTNGRDVHFYNNGLLLNSFATAPVANFNNTIHYLDTSGNVLRSATISTPDMNYGTFQSNVLPLSNGDMYIQNSGVEILDLQPGFALHSNFIKLDAALNVRWSKTYGHYTGGAFNFPVVGEKGGLTTIGNESGTTVPAYSSLSQKIQLKKIDSAAKGPNEYYCDFWNNRIIVTPQLAIAQPLSWSDELTMNPSVTNYPISLKTTYAEVHYVCPNDFIDSCSFIKITGPATLCNLDDTLTYKVHRNKACAQPVQWQVPQNVNLILQTDTELKIKLSSFGDYQIGALLPFSCTPVKDSITLTARPFKGINLDLGKDTSLCPGNTLVLHAGNKFLAYSWQDGSADSLFTVRNPGIYWVKTSDSCHNILTDSIVVTLASPVPLFIGPDRTKCNNDTLHLNAPADFLNYTWAPDYTISSLSTKDVIINPDHDITYFVKAEKTPGCFGYDTIKVFVKTSPPIYLGADTSFCLGDSIRLNAGPGFIKYTWNSLVANQVYIAKTKGMYSVTATDINGCKSSDTLNIVDVYQNPVVTLNHDSVLCIGTSRTLNAGNFNSYLWSTGSTASSITINNIGTYFVQVKDNNNCKGSDTTYVTKLSPLPSDFFASNTISICPYSSLNLSATANFKNYLWSNNSISPLIQVSSPGIYWLQVTDNNNCIGKDSISVLLKEDCMMGFYIPSAFTPNNDGKNDIFRPLLFGNLKEYRFAIYSKWGELVFQSEELGKGWDGTKKGMPQDTNVFVWTCSYLLEGGKPEIKKGIVTLIR